MSTEKIQALNDTFRTTLTGGKVLMTAGVNALPSDVKAMVIRRVATFSDFNEDNDPHGATLDNGADANFASRAMALRHVPDVKVREQPLVAEIVRGRVNAALTRELMYTQWLVQDQAALANAAEQRPAVERTRMAGKEDRVAAAEIRPAQ